MTEDEKNKWCREREFEFYKHVTTLFSAIGLLYATVADKANALNTVPMTLHLVVFGIVGFGILLSTNGMLECSSLKSEIETSRRWRFRLLLILALVCGGLGLLGKPAIEKKVAPIVANN